MPQHHPVVTDRKVAALKQAMGPVIASALADRMVVEVMVNPDGKIWVDRIGEGRSFTGQSLASVRIDTLPAAGTLLLNGSPVLAGALVPVADIAAGLDRKSVV